jgi:hypothetical protein
MAATGVTVTDSLEQVIFLMSSMPFKYSTTIQLWRAMKEDELTADKAVYMLRQEELRQKQEQALLGTDGGPQNKA